jgi:iron complex outermembrane receptor protein
MKYKILTFLLAASLGFAQKKAADRPITVLDALTIESSPIESVTQTWSALSGDELYNAKGLTIADTLSDIPGVSQTTFGPSANRPVIRGADKFRLRVLQNGTDTFDVSAQSEDHAVPIDPLMVDRIEVLRGSSALLYGGGAIGGVVNVIDRSIPTGPYDSSGASVLSSYSSVNEGLSYGAIAFGSSDKLSFQINGSKRDYEDYDAPTFETEDHHDPSAPAEVHPNGVENSHSDSTSIGFGASYMLDSGFVGFSLSSFENDYGVPGEHAESDTLIEMESDRFEFRSEIEISDSDLLTGIDLNFGYGDYQHSESGYEEENGTTEWHTHATYLREGFEGRIAFKHEIGELSGVFGVHGLFDEFKIVGEESIFGGLSKVWNKDGIIGGTSTDDNQSLPSDDANPAITNEDSSRIALFLIEQYDLSEDTTLNAGIRWEQIDRKYEAATNFDKDETTFSASGGVSHDLSELWNLSGNVSYSERTPDSAELYSDGAHHATEAYEIGNPNLENESAVGVEIIVRKTVGKVTGQFSAFHTKYNDYIFLEHTENERDSDGNLENTTAYSASDGFPTGTEGLEEKAYEAVDAEFQGIEFEIDWLAMENPGWDLLLSFYGDTLRGKNKTEGGNLPRIPASRLGIGFEVMQENLDFGLKLTRSMKQDNLGDDEEVTPAFSLLNAFASYDVSLGDSVGELFVRGTNLTDELAYNHASVLKQYAPLPGRSVEIGLKFDF